MATVDNNLLDPTHLSEVISAIYQAGLEGNWRDLIAQIRDITQSNKAIFFLHRLDGPTLIEFEFITNFQHCPLAFEEYKSRTLEDPYFEISQRIAEGDSININEHMNILAIVKTDYYQRILLPLKSHYVMSGCLIRDGVYESIYAINRGADDQPYTEIDYRFIKIITPHFSRALQIYRNLALYKNETSLAQNILDKTNRILVVCDEKGHVTMLNGVAEKAIEQYDEFTIDNGKFRLTNSALNYRFQQLFAECLLPSSGNLTHKTMFLTTAGRESILLSMSALEPDNLLLGTNKNGCLINISNSAMVSWNMLQSEFRLTNKELVLVKALYMKKKLRTLAIEQGISHNTLATHLKSIYKKMGVHSQSELVVTLGLFRQ